MVQDLLFRLGWSGVSLVFVLVGLHTMNNGRKQRAQSARIADTETTPVRDLRPGTVEVKGTASPAEDATAFEAPITRTDALATYVEVEEWQTNPQGGGSWETVHEDATGVPMTVEDDTGEVRVELPPDGELNVEETETTVEAGEEPPEAIRRYVEGEADVEAVDRGEFGPVSLGERRRYSEGALEPGEEVYVLGEAREARADWGERDYVIDEPTDSGDFVLSDKSESELIREGKRGGLVRLAFGAVLAVVGAVFAFYPWVAS